MAVEATIWLQLTEMRERERESGCCYRTRLVDYTFADVVKRCRKLHLGRNDSFQGRNERHNLSGLMRGTRP